MNDLDEIMARMAMMEGRLDPGYYQLVASGEIRYDLCQSYHILRPELPIEVSRCPNWECCKMIAEEPQSLKKDDEFLKKRNRKQCSCRSCPFYNKEIDSEKAQQNKKKQ
jgi:hypothetical protein